MSRLIRPLVKGKHVWAWNQDDYPNMTYYVDDISGPGLRVAFQISETEAVAITFMRGVATVQEYKVNPDLMYDWRKEEPMDTPETVLIVGGWRNGLPTSVLTQVREVEGRFNQGYRQLPYESTVMYLVSLLDGYDEFANDPADNEEAAADEAVQ